MAREKPKSNKFYKPPAEEFPADFLDRIELPRIMRAPNLINPRAPPQRQDFYGPFDMPQQIDGDPFIQMKPKKKKKPKK
jgi:hypothetical protein